MRCVSKGQPIYKKIRHLAEKRQRIVCCNVLNVVMFYTGTCQMLCMGVVDCISSHRSLIPFIHVLLRYNLDSRKNK